MILNVIFKSLQKQNHFPDPKFSVHGMHYMFFTEEIFCIMLDNVRSKFFIENM